MAKKKSTPAKKKTVKKVVQKATPKKTAPRKVAKTTSSAVKKKVATAKKKVVASKPTKKSATKSASAKKTVPAKKAVKKAAPKASVPAKAKATTPAKKKAPAPKKPVSRSYGPAPEPIRKRAPVLSTSKKRKRIKPLTDKDRAEYRKLLLEIRDQLVDDIKFLAGDNLNRSQRDAAGDLSGYSLHMADQGTDNFDREFALNLVSSEQDVLYEVDEALRRLDAGTYGLCEMSGEPIERARLKAIPFARYTVVAQSEMEKSRTRYRPFGPTLSHGGR